MMMELREVCIAYQERGEKWVIIGVISEFGILEDGLKKVIEIDRE
jgi:hypothetical protein